jgi:hypothetical protein
MEPMLTLFPLLPVVLAAFAVRHGSRLALVPVAIFALQLAWWLTYTFTNLISNPGIAGAWKVFILPTVAGLIIAVIALLHTSSAHAQSS